MEPIGDYDYEDPFIDDEEDYLKETIQYRPVIPGYFAWRGPVPTVELSEEDLLTYVRITSLILGSPQEHHTTPHHTTSNDSDSGLKGVASPFRKSPEKQQRKKRTPKKQQQQQPLEPVTLAPTPDKKSVPWPSSLEPSSPTPTPPRPPSGMDVDMDVETSNESLCTATTTATILPSPPSKMSIFDFTKLQLKRRDSLDDFILPGRSRYMGPAPGDVVKMAGKKAVHKTTLQTKVVADKKGQAKKLATIDEMELSHGTTTTTVTQTDTIDSSTTTATMAATTFATTVAGEASVNAPIVLGSSPEPMDVPETATSLPDPIREALDVFHEQHVSKVEIVNGTFPPVLKEPFVRCARAALQCYGGRWERLHEPTNKLFWERLHGILQLQSDILKVCL